MEERFWAKVNKNGPVPDHHPDLGPCWLWTASLNSAGYGQFGLNKRMRKSHRVAYETVIGPIPDGLVLDHLCKVPSCVNPRHLEPVTNAENLRRSSVGEWQTKKTRCPYGHPYDGDNLYITPDGRRYCRACRRIKLKTGRPVAEVLDRVRGRGKSDYAT